MDYPAIYWRRIGLRSRQIRFSLGSIPSGLELRLKIVLGVAALALGLVISYLIVSGMWYFAAGLLLVIPGAILLHNYPWLGLAGWLVVAQFVMAINGSMLRQAFWLIHRGLPLVILAVIILSAMFGIRRIKAPGPTKYEFAMFGYAAVSMASAFLLSEAADNEAAYRVYDRIVVPMIFYLVVRLLVEDEEDLQRLLPFLFVIALSQAFFGFVYIFARGALPSYWLRDSGTRATGSLVSPAVFTVTLLFVGTLLLHAALSNHVKGILRFVFIGVFTATIGAVFFTFSRGSWLAAVVALTSLFVIYRGFIIRFAMLALPVVIIVAGSLLADEISYADDRLNTDQTVRGRLPVVYASLQMFEARPIFGFGYNNFDNFDRQFQDRVGDVAAPEKDHASHNVYLTILAEQGAVGFILFILPVVGLFMASLKKWRDLPTSGFWSRKLLIVLWSVIAAHFAVNNFSNMRVVYGLGLYWINLALIAVLVLGPSRQAERRADY
jgi:O-antigen ligase